MRPSGTHLYDRVCPSVGPSVRQSVRPSHFTFWVFAVLASLLLPKWSGDLNYGPCPPARGWGSRVSGLVFYCALIHEFSHSNSLGLQASVCKIYSQIRVVTVNKKEVTELVVRIWLMQRRTTKRNHAIPTPRAKGKAFQMDNSPLRAYWPKRTWIQCQVCVMSYNQDL